MGDPRRFFLDDLSGVRFAPRKRRRGKKSWSRKQGERGGSIWVNSETGKEVYSQDDPGKADQKPPGTADRDVGRVDHADPKGQPPLADSASQTAALSPDHARALDSWLDASPAISPEQRQTYRDAFHQTAARLPAKALERGMANLKGVTFHGSTDDLANQARREGLYIKSGQQVGGLTIKEPRDAQVTMHLDGGAETGDAYPETAQAIYAHEIGHAIDCGRSLTGKSAWVGAWKEEIAQPSSPLSKYATKSPAEGFAELARLLAQDHESARKMFPKCYAFWQSEGLV